jgi:long-chain acyl-CoA synthetase
VAEANTLPRLLQRNAREFGARPAMRQKDRGIWQSYTWQQCHDQVRDLALGLAALGFRRGDKLSVIGDNRVRLYWAQIAAMCLGGISVPVYQDVIARELVFVLNHAGIAVIVAEDQEQVDKILSLKDQLPALRLVVYDDPRGIGRYRFDWLKSFDEAVRLGRDFGREHPDRFRSEIDRGRPEDVALICYTSGTTGNPKGAMLTHANVLSAAALFAKAEDVRRDDQWLAYLPMAWAGDAVYTVVLGLLIGFTANCPESPQTVQRDLRELGPTAFLGPPRIWENMLTGVQVRAADATPLKRWVFERFRAAAEQAEILRAEGKPLPLRLRLACALGELLVYRPVRDQLGLLRTRWCYSGGGPLGGDTFRFFRAFGVNLKQIYGSTELSGVASLQADGEADPNTAGRPAPDVEVRIGDGGEVLVKGPGVFKGYLDNDEATRQAIDAEGWFHTGDAGFIDSRGHLVIVERAKDVGTLLGGTAFAPQFIENKLKYSPYIREAVALGHERPFVAAMIAVDLQTVGSWAERRGVPYTSYMDLSQRQEVLELIREEVRKCNTTLPDGIRVRRFALLSKELDADDAEMTRTRKVRRNYVAQKYADVIEAFYSGKNEADLTATVTYEDGRQATVRSRLRMVDVQAAAGTEAPVHV